MDRQWGDFQNDTSKNRFFATPGSKWNFTKTLKNALLNFLSIMKVLMFVQKYACQRVLILLPKNTSATGGFEF